MFWSGNYIAVRELNYLLKTENVTLTQVLEADDILQECKADNKALIQFLTKPEVLAELITLITEEPPKDVELATQYRLATIACEVLTSHLSMLSDRLSLDTVQMNRLCDFINKDPPLNPLLASYFCKTVEMLLERSPKQDWYLYHIVCLRVLDFFKSRRDFLPNLLRHLATSAVADTFKCFIRLDDLFNKIVMEWLEEHQFLESLIQIICGTYVPEVPRCDDVIAPAPPAPAPAPAPGDVTAAADLPEKAEQELSEKPELNHKEDGSKETEKAPENQPSERPSSASQSSQSVEHSERARLAAERSSAVAAANAAALLCDLVLNGCAGEGCTTRLRTVWVLVSRLQSEAWVRALLGGMFTSPPRARGAAVARGCQVLLALLSADPILAGVCAGERTSVELAVAPHLPLLHQALLRDPPPDDQYTPVPHHESEGEAPPRGRVGWARVQVAALLAHLALSEVEDVPTTMITLGTPGTLVELMFRHPENNFLHAQVAALVRHALSNRAYRTMYAAHLLIECDLLTRLMDAFEENENKKPGVPRAGYMGHVIVCLRRVWRALDESEGELAHTLRLPDSLLHRFHAFTEHQLQPLLHHHDTPLGGYYPSENVYEVENMADSMEANYEFNDMVGGNLDELGEDIDINAASEMCAEGDCDGREGEEDEDGGRYKDMMSQAKKTFLEMANRRFDDVMWEDSPDADEELGGAGSAQDVHDMLSGGAHDALLSSFTAWESDPGSEGSEGGGWAQFERAAPQPPADPFAPPAAPADPAAPAAPADPAAPAAPPSAPADPADPAAPRYDAHFSPFWPDNNQHEPSDTLDLEESMRNLKLMSGSESLDELPDRSTDSPDQSETSIEVANHMANIVNANTPELSPRETETPASNTEAPVCNTETPVCKTEAPIRNTEAPVCHTEPPVCNTEAPVCDIEAPVCNIEAPVCNIEPPVCNTEAPASKTEPPVCNTEAPEANNPLIASTHNKTI